jgi:hypothetical protein
MTGGTRAGSGGTATSVGLQGTVGGTTANLGPVSLTIPSDQGVPKRLSTERYLHSE